MIAVTLLTTDAKKATAVVKDVTNIDGTACFMVSCTNLTNPSSDIFCSFPLSQILQYINASSAPIPEKLIKLQFFIYFFIKYNLLSNIILTYSNNNCQQVHEWKELNMQN